MSAWILLLSFGYVFAGTAPGGPGILGTWSLPNKDAFGSSYTQPVTFTLSRSVLSEVTYPHVDRVQTQESFLFIKREDQSYDERSAKLISMERQSQLLTYRAKTELSGVRVSKIVYADETQPAIIMDYEIQLPKKEKVEITFVHNPAGERTPGGDTIQVMRSSGLTYLRAFQVDIRGDEPVNLKPLSYQAVSWDLATTSTHVGFEGVNSPIEYLGKTIPQTYDQAAYGNVAGALYYSSEFQTLRFRVVLAFSAETKTLHSKLTKTLSQATSQSSSWASYLSQLQYDRSDTLAESSILVLKSLGDKIHKGAYIAAPAIPSLPWRSRAEEQNYDESRRLVGDSNAGYRRVWPRDLYHKAMALLSVGDVTSAKEIAQWYRKSQRPEGYWSQNMWVDGTPSWKALQLDQVGFPILLIEKLVKLNAINHSEYKTMVQKAAQFIVQKGPLTEQERWEEIGGLSSNTLAVAVQALLAASRLENSNAYSNVAQSWLNQMKSWLLVNNGFFGQNYFARIERNANPANHATYEIANKADGMKKYFSEDEILDGGFLQWILGGLIDPKDKDFSNTLILYDKHVRKNGGYLRYNHDSYGENFRGGIWPLLSAERGIAALERRESYRNDLELMRNLTTSAGMLGEQDTLAVRPLGWSHAAYLIFLKSIQDQKSFYRSN